MKLLDTNANNVKIKKSQKESKYRIASLSLYPNDTICPASILANCRKPCLVSAGFGAFSNVKAGRQAKTDFYMQDRQGFLDQLQKEIENSKKLFKRYNWPVIDVTRKSVEETAASVIRIFDIKKEKKKWN